MTSSPGSSSASMGKKMMGLPPGTTETCCGPTGMPRVRETCAAMASRKSGWPCGGAVVRPALVERLLGRFDDVGRSGEIGFADFQVNHAAALRFQRPGSHQNIESRFDSDAAHSFCEFHSNHQAYQPSPRRSAGDLVAGVLRSLANPAGTTVSCARDRIGVGAGQLVRALAGCPPAFFRFHVFRVPASSV